MQKNRPTAVFLSVNHMMFYSAGKVVDSVSLHFSRSKLHVKKFEAEKGNRTPGLRNTESKTAPCSRRV